MQTLAQDVAAEAARGRVGARGIDDAQLIDDIVIAERYNHLRVALEGGDERGDELRMPEIIIAEDGRVFPRSLAQAGLDIAADAEIACVAVEADTRVGEGRKHRSDIGRARVVADDDLEIAVGLGDDARHRLMQITRAVVGRDDHADERRGHRSGALAVQRVCATHR